MLYFFVVFVVFFCRCYVILSDITITTVKGIGYHCIIYINKSNIIHLLENSVLDDHGYI